MIAEICPRLNNLIQLSITVHIAGVYLVVGAVDHVDSWGAMCDSSKSSKEPKLARCQAAAVTISCSDLNSAADIFSTMRAEASSTKALAVHQRLHVYMPTGQ